MADGFGYKALNEAAFQESFAFSSLVFLISNRALVQRWPAFAALFESKLWYWNWSASLAQRAVILQANGVVLYLVLATLQIRFFVT